jgi:hypothetical protein
MEAPPATLDHPTRHEKDSRVVHQQRWQAGVIVGGKLDRLKSLIQMEFRSTSEKRGHESERSTEHRTQRPKQRCIEISRQLDPCVALDVMRQEKEPIFRGVQQAAIGQHSSLDLNLSKHPIEVSNRLFEHSQGGIRGRYIDHMLTVWTAAAGWFDPTVTLVAKQERHSVRRSFRCAITSPSSVPSACAFGQDHVENAEGVRLGSVARTLSPEDSMVVANLRGTTPTPKRYASV